MTRILKSQVKNRTDEIKRLILSEQPFEKELARLYTDLRLAAKHAWTVEVYRLLLLCVPDGQKARLYHPALVQAFVSLGQKRHARAVGQALLRKNPADPETRKLLSALAARSENALPPYTPLAALSKYAARAKPAPKNNHALCVPPAWRQAADGLTPQRLQELGYYAKKEQIARAPRVFRAALERDFDELVLNYLFDNRRAVVVLAGSFLEILMAMHLRRRLKIKNIAANGKPARDVFDLTLHDLIAIYAERKLLPEQLLRLGRAARVQRNFIHPGKELLEQSGITPAGARLCFLTVLEAMDALL